MKRTPIAAAALLACIAAYSFHATFADEPAATKPDGENAEKPNKFGITVSKETTFITEPLNADGTVDYVAAANNMLSKGVTKDNNAAVLIIKAFGPKFFRDEDPAPILKVLDITLPEDKDGVQYYHNYLEYASLAFSDNEYKAKMEFQKNMGDAELATEQQKPLTKDQRRCAKDWLQSNAMPLQQLTEASSRPQFYIPFIPEKDPGGDTAVFLNTSYLANMRLIANTFRMRALLLADEGEIDAAIRDTCTIARLGNLVSKKNLMIDRIVGISINVMAHKTAGYIASHCNLTAEEAKKCLTEFQKVPSLPPITKIFESNERFFALSFWQSSARFSLDEVTLSYAYPEEDKKIKVPDVQLNWDMLLKMENDYFDKLAEAASAKTFREQYENLRKLDGGDEKDDVILNPDEFGGTRGKLKKLIEEIGTDDCDKLTLAIWNFSHKDFIPTHRFFALDARQTAMRHLAEVAFAMAAYKAEKGEYPQKLADLAPDYLKTVPNDIYTDKPLIYRLADDGYVLYSVGEDMKDDGGDEGDDSVEKSLLVRVGEKPKEDESVPSPQPGPNPPAVLPGL